MMTTSRSVGRLNGFGALSINKQVYQNYLGIDGRVINSDSLRTIIYSKDSLCFGLKATMIVRVRHDSVKKEYDEDFRYYRLGSCPPLYYGNITIQCGSPSYNEAVMQCNGTQTTYNLTCFNNELYSTCTMLSGEYESCKTHSYTARETLCECSIGCAPQMGNFFENALAINHLDDHVDDGNIEHEFDSNVISNSSTNIMNNLKWSRRLQEGTEVKSKNIGIAEVLAMTDYTLNDLLYVTADPGIFVYSETYEKSIIVIIFFSTILLGLVSLVVLAEFSQRALHQLDAQKRLEDRLRKSTYKNSTGSSSIVPINDKETNNRLKTGKIKDGVVVGDKAFKSMKSFVNSLFPGSLSNESFQQQLKRELLSHQIVHRIVSANNIWEKLLILLRLLTTICLSAFIVAFLFSLQYPTDDGSCDDYSDELSCEQEKSIFDRDNSKCMWVLDMESGLSGCRWRPVSRNYAMAFLVLLVTILFTAPTFAALGFIFDRILAAPTTDDVDGEKRMAVTLKRFVMSTVDVVRNSIMSRKNGVGGMTDRKSNFHFSNSLFASADQDAASTGNTPANTNANTSDNSRNVSKTTTPRKLALQRHVHSFDEEEGNPNLDSDGDTLTDGSIDDDVSPSTSVKNNQKKEVMEKAMLPVNIPRTSAALTQRTKLFDITIHTPDEFSLRDRVAAETAIEKIRKDDLSVGNSVTTYLSDLENQKAQFIELEKQRTERQESNKQLNSTSSSMTTTAERNFNTRRMSRNFDTEGSNSVNLTSKMHDIDIDIKYKDYFEALVIDLEKKLNEHRRKLSMMQHADVRLEAFDRHWGLGKFESGSTKNLAGTVTDKSVASSKIDEGQPLDTTTRSNLSVESAADSTATTCDIISDIESHSPSDDNGNKSSTSKHI